MRGGGFAEEWEFPLCDRLNVKCHEDKIRCRLGARTVHMGHEKLGDIVNFDARDVLPGRLEGELAGRSLCAVYH